MEEVIGREKAGQVLAEIEGAIRLGGCTWDTRLQLLALAARAPTDRRGPWVYVTSLQGRYGIITLGAPTVMIN